MRLRTNLATSENPLLLKEGSLRALRAGGVVKKICWLKKPPRLGLLLMLRAIALALRRAQPPLPQKEGIFARCLIVHFSFS
jgi:hypothetical protein